MATTIVQDIINLVVIGGFVLLIIAKFMGITIGELLAKLKDSFNFNDEE